MKKIFHLDDSAELIEITDLLLRNDYVIRSRTTTDNIIEELKDFKPDLMLIDHFMGMVNSEDLVLAMKTAIPGFAIPFILFSASYDIEERAGKLGAAGFIEKPSSIQYIKKYIDGFFAQS